MTQREQWLDALYYHQREIERLSSAARDIDEAVAHPSSAPDERARRQIEYVTVQKMRHEISVALISSRLAA